MFVYSLFPGNVNANLLPLCKYLLQMLKNFCVVCVYLVKCYVCMYFTISLCWSEVALNLGCHCLGIRIIRAFLKTEPSFLNIPSLKLFSDATKKHGCRLAHTVLFRPSYRFLHQKPSLSSPWNINNQSKFQLLCFSLGFLKVPFVGYRLSKI